jgi:hypothetical protein
VRECEPCPVLGQLYVDGNPFKCKCSSNVGPGYTTAGDTCFETSDVTRDIEGITFTPSSIYSPVQARQITYQYSETFNQNTKQWNTNPQTINSGMVSYMYLKAAMGC